MLPKQLKANLFALLLATLPASAAAAQGDAAGPRPEHPFPQMVRAEWLNLNGTWEFAETDEPEDGRFLAADARYPDRILVPFCRESRLSGLARTGFVKNVWYRRTFTRPTEWQSPRVRLHVGACDYRTRVWVNGQLVGTHVGGSAPLVFDITPALRPGDNTLVIHAFDDTASGLQPTGKQSHKLESHGCVYTRTTGIWQTVWLEGVGASFIRDVRIEPDLASGRVLLQAEIDGPCRGLTLTAEARAGDQPAGAASASADWRHNRLVLNLAQPRAWSPADPFLYDLTLTLSRDGQPVDRVASYFGLRSVSIEGPALLINGRPLFQRTVLDQGFYPDGIWTAPSDAELRADIQRALAVGFNGARLHQKVFEPRFLHWADKLGYLVWGEFPNWGLNYKDPAVNLPVIDEWIEIVRRDRNHPALIGWCPFNETPPEAGPLQATVVEVTRALDPARPVIESSGYFHGVPAPDVLDAHDYEQDPATFRRRWTDSFGPDALLPPRYQGGTSWRPIPFFVSEYGGIGWNVSGGWGYGGTPESLAAFYERFQRLTDALLDNPYMFGYCYTQLTDVEQERNGIYSYDRKLKFDAARLREIQTRPAACEQAPPEARGGTPAPAWRVLVGAVPDGEQSGAWRYTLDVPPDGWMRADFDDQGWAVGQAGFGRKGGWEWAIRTPWTGQDVWLRRAFTCDGAAPARVLLVLHYDNATEVYLNGQRIWQGTGWNDRYTGYDVTAAAAPLLRAGANLLAIHCHQDEGGQFIDAALLVGP